MQKELANITGTDLLSRIQQTRKFSSKRLTRTSFHIKDTDLTRIYSCDDCCEFWKATRMVPYRCGVKQNPLSVFSITESLPLLSFGPNIIQLSKPLGKHCLPKIFPVTLAKSSRLFLNVWGNISITLKFSFRSRIICFHWVPEVHKMQ